MRFKERSFWFLAYTGIFAVLAGYVFWGTWSTMTCPVMPDTVMYYAEDFSWRDILSKWIADGKFTPFDLRFLFAGGYFWQELQFAIPLWISGLALAYYLRGRKLGYFASYGAGLFLAFCGYWATLFSAGHAGWFHWMIYGVFAFGLIDRVVRKNKFKNWLLLGAVIAWGGFYQPDLWFLFTLLSAVYFIWCVIREKRAAKFHLLLPGMALSLVVFLLIGMPSFIGAYYDKQGREKQIAESSGGSAASTKDGGDEARWIFVTNWSLPPEETLEFVVPRLHGDTSCPMVLSLGKRQNTGVRQYTGALGRPYGAKYGNYRQHSLYVGRVTCFLALLAVVFYIARKRGREDVFFFAGAAIIALLLSYGRYFEMLYRVVFALPVGDSLRAPVKWHHLTEFALCVLSGYGLNVLENALKSRSVSCAKAILAAIVVYGAADLARNDRLYCAAIDLSIVRGRNDAAHEIIERGNGKLLDFIERGNGLIGWSFNSHHIPVTGDANDKDVRFVIAPLGALKNQQFVSWQKSAGAKIISYLKITNTSIRKAESAESNGMLLQRDSVPPAPYNPGPLPPFSMKTVFGIISICSALAVSAILIGIGVAKSPKRVVSNE